MSLSSDLSHAWMRLPILKTILLKDGQPDGQISLGDDLAVHHWAVYVVNSKLAGSTTSAYLR
jgi:hypothetical protein